MKLALGILSVAVLLSGVEVASSDRPTATCPKVRLFRSHGVNVWSASGHHHAIFYKSGLAIDADGAFRAYHPDDRHGLDSLAHAGHPGDWWALVTDNGKSSGRPVVQGKSDPAPGYYVSTTALYDIGKLNPRDPHKYVDALNIPYVVLHPKALKYARLGDFATVVNLQNGRTSAALVADVSAPDLPVGEGSIALAKALGMKSNARNGGKRGGVVYLIYSGSGNGRPRPLQEIATKSKELLEEWGGLNKLNACLADD